MISQTLKVVSHGLIESGQVSFSADEVTGMIDEAHSIVVGVSVFNQTIASSEELKIDPALLRSLSIKSGMKWIIGGVTISVSAISLEHAQLNIAVVSPDVNMTGTAWLDLTQQFIKISSVVLNGVADGQTVTLELAP